MINYRTYEAEDFLFDESFRQWTTGTSPQAAHFWEQWLAQNPDRAEVTQQAQELIHALNDHYQDDATDDRIELEVKKLMSKAAERRETEQEEETEHPVIPLGQRPWWRWAVAASIMLMGVSTWFYVNRLPKPALDSYEYVTRTVTTIPLEEKVNTGTKAINVLLSDGSVVTLNPNSRLSYPSHFNTSARTVYLSGEAFFDVVKNPAKPFLIYANQTVTKVLGTSFLVRAYYREKEVTVMVKTGRVSVYSQKDYENAQQSGVRRVDGVVLTPNQQMTYNLEENRLVKALVEEPAALIANRPSREQVFEDASIARVFSSLERTYGVKLIFDEDALAACLVNVTFNEENLMERLDVICQTIGASYKVLDGQIVITSKGCQ
ncbi:FecR family protein [Larkinella arboricola]|uniref:FecR family protein n=1 Tax=Larkinella arboricola TaxID=643671 RepID=A0A327X450_LARAB|nr:FecR domain-containing protein [Larkinella arboricola]RAK01930.1 FecR family protein [Larkinella arboricola]